MWGGVLSLLKTVAMIGAAWGLFHAGEMVERGRWGGVQADAAKLQAATERGWSERLIAAQDGHAERLASIASVAARSTNTVREYERTVEGRAPCLPAERVRGIEATAVALRASATAEAGADAVPVDTDADAAGRVDVAR